MFNSFYTPDSSNDSSISRYGNFGPAGMMSPGSQSNDSGFNFSDILKAQMPAPPAISQQLDGILSRLENNQPLLEMAPENAAKQIFESLNLLESGTHDLLANFAKGAGSLGGPALPPPGNHIEEMHRLIEGAKQLFCMHQDPFVLEELAEYWEKFKKKKSPLFDSIQNLFFSIAISYSSETTSDYSYEEASVVYTEQTLQIFTQILENMPNCKEKEELEIAINLEHTETDKLEFEDPDMKPYLSSSEQANFFS